MATNEKLLTINQVCERLQFTRTWLYELWKEDKGPRITYVGPARRRRVKESDLRDWLESQQESAAAEAD